MSRIIENLEGRMFADKASGTLLLEKPEKIAIPVISETPKDVFIAKLGPASGPTANYLPIPPGVLEGQEYTIPETNFDAIPTPPDVIGQLKEYQKRLEELERRNKWIPGHYRIKRELEMALKEAEEREKNKNNTNHRRR